MIYLVTFSNGAQAEAFRSFTAAVHHARTMSPARVGTEFPEEARYSSMIDAWVVTPTDLRDVTNNRPHTAVPYAGPTPKTAAQAAKLRKKAMQACGCRLCALALNPPQTFAEWTRFGLDAIRAETDAAYPRHHSRFECTMGADCPNPNHNPKARRQEEEA